MLDNRAKRASMIQFAHPNILHLPIPDGVIDAPDRAHRLGLYAGIALETAAEIMAVLVGMRLGAFRLWF